MIDKALTFDDDLVQDVHRREVFGHALATPGSVMHGLELDLESARKNAHRWGDEAARLEDGTNREVWYRAHLIGYYWQTIAEHLEGLRSAYTRPVSCSDG